MVTNHIFVKLGKTGQISEWLIFEYEIPLQGHVFNSG